MRVLLSFTLASIAMGIGLRSAWIQAHNFERGAQLDRLQVGLDWYQRRVTGLRATLERMEFEALLEDYSGPEEGSE
ncbi:MAG: hypothetical protein ACI8QC_000137 [Planctomycetota bacterium]|jgi:hypothetical protein